jgi:hypothetical protein
VLIALLLPAVQAAREASRRSTCTNHLKQLGLGIHNFHNTHGTIPPMRSGRYVGWPTDGHYPSNSFLLSLCPFIEQEVRYNEYVSAGFLNYWHDNYDWLKGSIPVLWCPSDLNSSKPAATNAYTRNSYYTSVGDDFGALKWDDYATRGFFSDGHNV